MGSLNLSCPNLVLITLKSVHPLVDQDYHC